MVSLNHHLVPSVGADIEEFVVYDAKERSNLISLEYNFEIDETQISRPENARKGIRFYKVPYDIDYMKVAPRGSPKEDFVFSNYHSFHFVTGKLACSLWTGKKTELWDFKIKQKRDEGYCVRVGKETVSVRQSSTRNGF